MQLREADPMNRTGISALAGLGILLAACAPATPALGLDGLVEALIASGASVEIDGEVEQTFFAVPGRILRVDGQDVQVFEYPDSESRQADSDQVGPDGSEIGTTMVTWIDTPHFWAKDRLIVIWVGQDESTIAALSAVLGEPIAGG